MQTRRDRVQAHNYTVGRLGTAMLEADPDAADKPMLRTRTGTYIGMGLGALICIGFLIFGFIFPGGASTWRQEGRLVVDRETGATYLYGDGMLRPVANYASAMLIADGQVQASQVRSASIQGERLGGPVGIPGAPDALPAAENLADNVWRLCALPPAEENGDPRSALMIGPDAGGEPLGGRAALVTGPDGVHHLLWNDVRMALPEESGALQALGYGTTPAPEVPEEFLETVPEAPELAAPEVRGAGDEGPAIAGAPSRVGQVFTVAAPDGSAEREQHYLLTRDGLVPLTLTDTLLLLADPDIRESVYGGGEAAAVVISAGDATSALAADPEAAGPAASPGPASPPETAPAEAGLPCLRLQEGELALTLYAPETVDAWEVAEVPGVAPGCPTPDLIGVPTGGGTVAAASPLGGSARAPATYLVTDTPAKYRVPDDGALSALGYQPSVRMDVPTSLLRLLPSGPTLSPQAASQPVGEAGAGAAAAAECP
ncbi:type VII secretion protein EccB [Nocardiopsis trehalosi]|uniref:type VII secretion protein EccB n=1 Tax=Nocardiopsis trehalosi TaxID=109329 RepID=UPI00082B8E9C|nr:type VII secretion protein EccB [Nocardiopsis trehalosi]